ncbi:MAG: hypothetical protein ABIJ34_07985 [archaeon]
MNKKKIAATNRLPLSMIGSEFYATIADFCREKGYELAGDGNIDRIMINNVDHQARIYADTNRHPIMAESRYHAYVVMEKSGSTIGKELADYCELHKKGAIWADSVAM